MIKVILFIITTMLVIGSVILVSIYSIQPAQTEDFVFSGSDSIYAILAWVAFWASIEFRAYIELLNLNVNRTE